MQVADATEERLRAHPPDADMKMYPDLELWIDDDGDSITITVDGVLDPRTGPSLLKTIHGLVTEGHGEILVRTGNLRIAPSDGFATLVSVIQSLRAFGVRGELGALLH
jgi:hypothetical protein